ncbi:hypothetical protein IWQ62_001464 [Dispira parvispora]|uniref:Uncharacterized protein n=1 Tax=Dispira parvispora TaxID=1520584 RepID=A0A9W8E854_9FUNG|nr:hypothetical protein IWQ62_001464 [Dispira parvispora]
MGPDVAPEKAPPEALWLPTFLFKSEHTESQVQTVTVPSSYDQGRLQVTSHNPRLQRRATPSPIESTEASSPSRRHMHSLTLDELRLVQSNGYDIQRWFFFAIYCISCVYAAYQLGAMVWLFGLQVNLRASVYLSILVFGIVSMVCPVGPRLSIAQYFFTVLFLQCAFVAYLALVMTWSRFMLSFHPSSFGTLLIGCCYALGGYTTALAFLLLVGAFEYNGAAGLNEFVSMLVMFTLPIFFWLKAAVLATYGVQCYRRIPRDLKPQSILNAIIKLTVVVIATQVGWALLPIAAITFIVRSFTDNPSAYLAFVVFYNLCGVFSFMFMVWLLTVHDSVPTLWSFLSPRVLKHHSSVYMYTDQYSVSSPTRESPLLAALPAQERRNGTGPPAIPPSKDEPQGRQSQELQTLIRQISKHSLFRSSAFVDLNIPVIHEEKPFKLGRFQWERDSNRSHQLQQLLRVWGGSATHSPRESSKSRSLRSSVRSWLPGNHASQGNSRNASRVSMQRLLEEPFDNPNNALPPAHCNPSLSHLPSKTWSISTAKDLPFAPSTSSHTRESHTS